VYAKTFHYGNVISRQILSRHINNFDTAQTANGQNGGERNFSEPPWVHIEAGADHRRVGASERAPREADSRLREKFSVVYSKG
jgi:hypothetical protein